MKALKVPSPTSAHKFSQVPRAEIERSQFDRSHGIKTTFDEGFLIPVYVDEALPGDTFRLSMNGFARLSTPIKPLMDNMYLESFFFAVPMRLVWANFQKFMGEQTDPGDSTSFTIPQVVAPAGGFLVGTLEDYLGLPTGIAGISVSTLFRRAYFRIWNEWFRDENLQDSETLGLATGDGPDSSSTVDVLRRGKRHDYFTSCLPWPQKGTAVSIPLGTSADVVRISSSAYPRLRGNSSGTEGYLASDATAATAKAEITTGGGGGSFTLNERLNWAAGPTASGLMTDLSTATAATINSLRQAFQMQKLLERDARGGTRYTEIVKAHFGVTSPDARLQRPEYLGGGSTPVMVSPIAQTSSTDATTPQGNLTGVGTASWQGHGFVKSFTEHCILLGLVCVRADLTYQQGIDRMFSRSTKYDFYWPALAHIGEQSVYNREIYAQGTSADADVFGYQERYAEYRYKPSKVTGLFRSAAAGSLDVWHLAQEFGALPALDDTFIVENAPVDRVVAVPSEPHFYFDGYFDLKCARPMPVYGVPGLIDHF